MNLTEMNPEIYEMARVQPAASNVACTIFVTTSTYAAGSKPRIKVSNQLHDNRYTSDTFSVSIEKAPRVISGTPKIHQKIIEDVFRWIKLNEDHLLKYWEDDYEGDSFFYHDIKKIESPNVREGIEIKPILNEMSRVNSNESGLSCVIFVSSKDAVDSRHGARIKVSNLTTKFSKSDNFTITINNDPQVIGKSKLKQNLVNDIIDWVLLNKEPLMKYWNNDYDDDEKFFSDLTKL